MIDPQEHEMDDEEAEVYRALIDAAREARECEEADLAWQARKDGEPKPRRRWQVGGHTPQGRAE